MYYYEDLSILHSETTATGHGGHNFFGRYYACVATVTLCDFAELLLRL